MQSTRSVLVLAVLAAISGTSLAAAQGRAPAAQGQAGPHPAASPAAGLPKVCLDAQTGDALTQEFVDGLKAAITASGAMSVASTSDSCTLNLHVPGNLLRFETAGGVMVGTVVIVTSASGRYLSTNIAACQAGDLKPCAIRAVSAAKLALLVAANDGS